MTEQEIKPIIAQLYAELFARFNTEPQDTTDQIAEYAEMMAEQFMLDMNEEDLNRLLSLSPEKLREEFNKGDFTK
jgi:hypothetical protein